MAQQDTGPRYCHQCGAVLGQADSFCGNCGASLDGGAVAPYDFNAPTTPNLEYMGFWIRLAAILVDSLVIVVVVVVLSRVLGVGGLVLGYVLVLLYPVVFISLKGQTLGKMAVGIQVVDSAGNIPSLGSTLMREIVGKFVSGLLFDIGYLWVAWDSEKRGWHDHIARTHVVRKPRERAL